MTARFERQRDARAISALGPPPAEALARLMAMRDALGITRIADITGLDRIGIPVMQAVEAVLALERGLARQGRDR